MKNISTKIMYFAFSIPMYYFYTGGFSFVGINFFYCFLLACALAAVTFFVFLVKPNLERMALVAKWTGILTLPYLITIFISLIIWVLNMTGLRIMLRGFVWPCYQILAIFAAASAVYLFGKKGIYYQLTALFIAYLMFFGNIVIDNGVAAFINDYIGVLTTRGEYTGCFDYIETIAYAHGMGLFIIYLVFTVKENKLINILFLIPAIFCFISGYKRSAVTAFIISFIIFAVGSLLNDANKRIYCVVAGIVMTVGALVYIALINSRILDLVIETFNINTMGRQEIYEYMRDYYEFDLTYIGKGLGFISYSIGTGLINVGSKWRGDIHNDFLRQYIELGMIGFIAWAWFFFEYRVRALAKDVDAKAGLFMLVCMGYCWSCYMTENMYYRFSPGLALSVVVLSYCLQRKEANEKQLRESGLFV